MILCSGQLTINSYGLSSSVNHSVKDPSAKPDQIIFDFFPSDAEKEPATTDDLSSPMLNSLFQGVDNREVCGDTKDNDKDGLVNENCSALPSSPQKSLGQLPPPNSMDGLSDLPQNNGQNAEPEICGDGEDNNGNGEVDENCNNQSPGGNDDNQNPEPEICGDGEDNNGNGAIDEDCKIDN